MTQVVLHMLEMIHVCLSPCMTHACHLFHFTDQMQLWAFFAALFSETQNAILPDII